MYINNAIKIVTIALIATFIFVGCSEEREDEILDENNILYEACGVEINEYLNYQEGDIWNNHTFRLLYEVKDGYQKELSKILDSHFGHSNNREPKKTRLGDEKFDELYHNGNIKEVYITSLPDKGKSCIGVYFNLIEQDGKMYLLVFTW